MSWESFINSAIQPPVQGGGGRAPRVSYDYVVQGLMDRGLPQHVAEGFAMNVGDESGFDAGINERNPLVKGSRGGYGLYQVTGPRRRAYEAFAAQSHRAFNDPEAQLDFAVWEFEHTEKRAADKIMNTKTAGEAAAAIVNDFLRPAPEHRRRRAAKYLGSGVPNVDRQQAQSQEPTVPGLADGRLWLDFDMGVS